MHTLLIPESQSRDRSTVASWIREAIGRRAKVLYKHAPTEDAAAVLARSLPTVGVEPGVLASGQVQLADTTELRAETGGTHEALYALHLQQLGQATRQGFTGLALTGDAAAMHTITRDGTELAGYERGLERLAVEAGVRSLCRYAVEASADVLDDMLAVHYRDVADDVWSAQVVDRRLRMRGDLDFTNAARFASVLRAALTAGVRTLDASELLFCDVAGIRAVVSATDVLGPDGSPLTLTGVDGLLGSMLALTGALHCPALQVGDREADA
jgi:anti-anti-sigma regulatory factor